MDSIPIKIVVVETEPLLKALLTDALDQVADLNVVGSHTDMDEATRTAARLSPDVVVIGDVIAAAPNGVELALALQRQHPARLLVLAQRIDAHLLAAAEVAENWSYLLRSSITSLNSLSMAIRATAQGFAMMDPAIPKWRRTRSASDARQTAATPHLISDRQEQILALVAAGKSNAAIAEQLFISERSVESHLSRIYTALAIPTGDRDAHPRVQVTLSYLSRRPRHLSGIAS
jgi:DNA-binding NarL/FixJ family response regulator